MNASLFVLFGFLLFIIYTGITARKGKDMNLEQWAVGGRGFGTILVFLLMAGESYTTFTFLGASSWAYGKGGPAFYIIAYLSLIYCIFYWLYPNVWKYAKTHRLVSQSDFFASKYKSPYLGVITALIGVISMIPYIVLQLKGLGIIVSEASYGFISPTVATWIGVISVTVYVMISGIHGSAKTAIIKDILIFGVVVFIGIYIPYHYYGGIESMFREIQASNPDFLKLPDFGLGISWFISTVVMTSIGGLMWPHLFVATYSAAGPKAIRKNAVITPLYTLMLLFIFFVGFAAIKQVPGLQGAETDLALLRISIQTFDPWFVGVIGAAGLLTALVPGSMLLMTASVTLSKNVYKVIIPSASEKQISMLSKMLVPVISLICVYFTFNGGNSIVTLLLMAYSFITQLFPAILFSLAKNNVVTKQGAAAGMIAGVITVAYITITNATIGTMLPALPQVLKDLNSGIIALGVNIIIMLIVSAFTKQLPVSSEVKNSHLI
ncbi:sodium:solute symporter family protein [Peribacillus frigoritolerans]|uniref:sodium:solute symporter family protein n=1 Tax=Peribacillus frigoritolerans TaxID=450367 RepID=UPI0006C333F3|nr:sodium:solute symporter [Peribacillus frigoritolerans]KOR82992.1 sodium:solute symporter [Bacillus sp. FJAT-22058]MBL3645317.1 sodium:solute symporter [Bacillus sp. RHFB]MCK2004978.1 sodium:solute symporter [Peribacillus frigoritolerans]MEE3952346.1 sodium:solute symporter [Peribacillus frigoritolerans]